LSLALETGENLRIAGDGVGKEFESDKTMQAGVFGFVDYAHAAAAELLDDAVVRMPRAESTKCHTKVSQLAGAN